LGALGHQLLAHASISPAQWSANEVSLPSVPVPASDLEPDSTGSPVERWLSRGSWFALALVAAGAIALRLLSIDHLPGINADETYYGVHALELMEGRPIALRSGSDLPLNAPFFGLVWLLHMLFEPSLMLMRSTTVIHSIATVGLAYVLFRDRGRQFALLFALLVAVLPVHLGYARLAWDPSAVPTVMVLALAAATHLCPVLTALAFVLLLWVHPTTVFALPILIAPFIAARIKRSSPPVVDAAGEESTALPSASYFSPQRVLWMCGLAFSCAGIAFAMREHLPASIQQALDPGRLALAGSRLTNPDEMMKFVLLFADFVSGLSTFEYLTGVIDPTAIHLHRLGCIALLVVGMFAMDRLWATRARVEIAVLYGVLASLCLAYPLSGQRLLLPHSARYGMFLTIPICYVLASWLQALAARVRPATAVRFAAAALGAILLFSFQTHVLQALRRPAPARAFTFRTGETDPKQLAFEAAMRMRQEGRLALLLTKDWWIYWTVRYLAHGAPRVSVTIHRQRPDYRFPSDFVPRPAAIANAELFAITWADHALDQAFAARAKRSADIFGFEPTPILRVHALNPAKR
jgi:hypothetical protein